MNDKELFEDILVAVKTSSDLLLHGTIESSTQNVHCAFDTALKDTLNMQNEIYNKMSQKGWYPAEQAEQNKISQVKQNFSAQK